MNRIARRFVLLALGLALGLTGGVALLNLIVDPFNRYGLNHLGVYISAERECKSTYVTRFPHDALLVGNSREIRIPPAQLEGFRFFNGAFSGATPEEIYFFLQHFARHQRLVVLAVDIGEQDPAECARDIFALKGLISALDNLLNLQTTEYSIRTISESLSKYPEPIGLDGLVPVGSSMLDADRNDPETGGLPDQGHATDVGWISTVRRWQQMSFYVKISECLRQRGIPCVVVIPPTQEAVAQSVQSGSAAAEVAAWKRQLNTIFPHVIYLSFSSYDAATQLLSGRPDALQTRRRRSLL